MKTLQPSSDWMINIIQVGKITGRDDRNKPNYDMHTYENCRFDIQSVYSGSGNDRQIQYNGVLFFYAALTTPFPKMDKNWLDGKVIDEDGNEYKITQVIPIKKIQSNEVHAYEIEVI